MAPRSDFLCQYCAGKFSRRYNLLRHIERRHTELQQQHQQQYVCEYCKETFETESAFSTHVKQEHRRKKTFNRASRSLNVAALYDHAFDKHKVDSFDYAFTNRKAITEVLQYELLKKNVVKASINLTCTFVQVGTDGEETDRITFALHSKFYTLYRMQAFGQFVRQCKSDINMRFEDLTVRGSGWSLHRVHKMTIAIVKVKDLLSGSGGCTNGNDINVKKLKRGRYLVNPPSIDNKCFYYCIAYHMTKSSDVNVLTDYIRRNIHVVTEGPVKIGEIAKFEKKNAHLDVAINVVQCRETGSLFPLYNSKNRKAKHRISLLLYFASSLHELGHYMYITDFNKYASYCYLKKKRGQKEQKVIYLAGFYCHNCLLRFRRKDTFKKHIALCNENKTQQVLLPKKDTFTEFNCYRKTVPYALSGYSDFEAKMQKCDYCTICVDARKCTHNTTNVNQHEPFAVCVMIFDRDNEVVLDFTYAGDDCVEKLLNHLLDNEERLRTLFHRNLPMKWTSKEKEHYKNSKTCFICSNPVLPSEIACRHHEHSTGKYLGKAHQSCNLNAKHQECVIPIYLHNFSNYDANFIVRALDKVGDGCQVNILPHNTEKIRKLDLNCFSFMDSLDFLSGSLADLTNDLTLSNHEFPLMKNVNLYKTNEERALLLRKGVFPYSIVRDHVQLMLMDSLPPKEAFFSDLTQTPISDVDYEHARKVWFKMKIKNMLQYCFLYLRLDTVLLAESFIRFRNEIFESQGLDCCQFLSTPHLSFHLMLKITKVRLEHLSDDSMVQFCMRSLRGGHSFVNVRASEQNTELNHHMAYWDANNLYGLGQSQLLPTDNYRWMKKEEFANIDWHNVNTETDLGMICEVDLEYPPELHYRHNSFVLAPEKKNISFDELSPYSQNVYSTLNHGRTKYTADKLTATFNPRKKYVVHFANLRFYLKHGLILKKVRRVLAFRQTYFLRTYIDYCTQKRQCAMSTFSKNLFKLLANSCYGKFIQSDLNRIRMNICTDERSAQRFIASPLFIGFRIISEGCLIVFRHHSCVRMKQHYAVGFSILEYSKLHMYKLYYEVLQPHFRKKMMDIGCNENGIEVLMSDTDSFLVGVRTTNLEKDLKQLKSHFDFSNYPKDHVLYDESNKNVIGYLKDELAGNTLQRYVGIRSKAYVIEVQTPKGKETKVKCKGIVKAYRNRIQFEKFLACISHTARIKSKMRTIRSRNNILKIIQQNKTAVSSFDDKRYLCGSGIHSLAFGSTFIHRANNFCQYCPNAKTFFTSKKAVRMIDVSK